MQKRKQEIYTPADLALDHAGHPAHTFIHIPKVIILAMTSNELPLNLRNMIEEGKGCRNNMSLPLKSFTQFENFGHSLRAPSYRFRPNVQRRSTKFFSLPKNGPHRHCPRGG